MTEPERRWAIVTHRWVTTADGLQAFDDRQVHAYASSMGQARLLTLQLNKAGNGRHWSVEPVGEEVIADGPSPSGADATGAE